VPNREGPDLPMLLWTAQAGGTAFAYGYCRGEGALTVRHLETITDYTAFRLSLDEELLAGDSLVVSVGFEPAVTTSIERADTKPGWLPEYQLDY